MFCEKTPNVVKREERLDHLYKGIALEGAMLRAEDKAIK
jgi:hypothetical protein